MPLQASSNGPAAGQGPLVTSGVRREISSQLPCPASHVNARITDGKAFRILQPATPLPTPPCLALPCQINGDRLTNSNVRNSMPIT